MTSATGNMSHAIYAQAKGFSILELLVVLGVMALFTGSFALYFASHEEEVLSEVSSELKSLALQAKRRSFAFRREEHLILSATHFSFPEPQSAIRPDSRATPTKTKLIHLPANTRLEVRRPGEASWRQPQELRWKFYASGLNEPLQVRFSKGDAYTTLTFHTLTGQAEEETVLN